LTRKKVEKQRLNLKEITKRFADFLGRRYIWSGLLAGFLWTFPMPFVLTAFLSSLQNLPEGAIWILFFPLKLSFLLTDWMMKSELVDPISWTFILWITSIFVGMFIGVVFTYSAHLIRVWGRKHKVQIARTKPMHYP